MGDSKIQWTGKTWNPIAGCSIKSPGCINCYAMRQAARIERMLPALEHYRGLTKPSKNGPIWTGKITSAPDETLNAPRRWHKPQLIFVNSMSDLFHEDAPDPFSILTVMRDCHWHTFQVLTKRSDVMRMRLRNYAPLPNVLVGVSVERNKEANERRDDLAQLAAAGWRTFVSYEPALGDVDWSGWGFLSWAIAGGESGPHARRCWVPNIRSAVKAWRSMDIPTFVKQLGSNVQDRNDAGFMGEEPDEWPDLDMCWIEHVPDGTHGVYQGDPVRVRLKHRKGGDMEEWPEDLRIREFPDVR